MFGIIFVTSELSSTYGTSLVESKSNELCRQRFSPQSNKYLTDYSLTLSFSLSLTHFFSLSFCPSLPLSLSLSHTFSLSISNYHARTHLYLHLSHYTRSHIDHTAKLLAINLRTFGYKYE